MAVGSYDIGKRIPGLSEVLSAGTWTVKPVPSPSRGSNIFANEVSCSSATSCLFVGAHFAGAHGNFSNLAESWNGSKWHIVSGTGLAGVAFSALNDVACPTAKLCLVIGDGGSTKHFQDTAYTWRNGSTLEASHGAAPKPRPQQRTRSPGLRRCRPLPGRRQLHQLSR
jgi:hypothetical protein